MPFYSISSYKVCSLTQHTPTRSISTQKAYPLIQQYHHIQHVPLIRHITPYQTYLLTKHYHTAYFDNTFVHSCPFLIHLYVINSKFQLEDPTFFTAKSCSSLEEVHFVSAPILLSLLDGIGYKVFVRLCMWYTSRIIWRELQPQLLGTIWSISPHQVFYYYLLKFHFSIGCLIHYFIKHSVISTLFRRWDASPAGGRWCADRETSI